MVICSLMIQKRSNREWRKDVCRAQQKRKQQSRQTVIIKIMQKNERAHHEVPKTINKTRGVVVAASSIMRVEQRLVITVEAPKDIISAVVEVVAVAKTLLAKAKQNIKKEEVEVVAIMDIM